MQQIPLPPCPAWECHDDVAAYAEACLAFLHLEDWSFGWDRAIRRLGCCRCRERRITLSRHFVAAYLSKDGEQIRRTLLHEIAHALAWTHHRSHGHSAIWKRYCAALGIPNERATTRCEDFAPTNRKQRTPRFELCHKETGEVFRTYTRKPRTSARRLRHCYIPGRKSETLGQLIIRELPPQE